MTTKYLVTGAAGHLGNTIVGELIARGEQVRALVLPNDSAAKRLPKQVEIVEGDVLDLASLERFFAVAADTRIVVIHCAGIVTVASKYQQIVYDVNVTGTKNIVDLCLQKGAHKLVYISSVHAIPELPKGQVITEIKGFDPNKVIGLYAKTKAAATALVLESVKKGLNASVVHPAGICGPYDYGKGHLTQLVIDYYKGKLAAAVDGGYDFVDVRDVAQGVLACCEQGKPGECYILSNHYYSIPEVLEVFHDVTGKKRIKTFLPMWLAKATAPLGELYYKLRKQPPLYTPYSLHTLTSNGRFSNDKARRELGYHVRPFKLTVADTVRWLACEHRI